MKKEEFKIGEVFQCGLVKLKCVKANKECDGCFFDKLISSCMSSCIADMTGECDSGYRLDKTDVIFVKMEE